MATATTPVGALPKANLKWIWLSVAIAVAVHAQAQLTLLHISDLGHHPKRRSSETAAFHALAEAASDMNPQVVELTAEKPAEVLFRQGQRYDTVILGAHMSPLRPVLLLGSRLARAMDELPGTVIITRASAKTREAA